MKNTDSQNMEDFNRTGCKILPHPSIQYIDEQTHRELLDESMYKYRDIWEVLSKG